MDIENFDVIEKSNRNVMDYEQYFGEMDISEDKKQKRIDFANSMETMLLTIMALYSIAKQLKSLNKIEISNKLAYEYKTLVNEYVGQDIGMDDYIDMFSYDFVDAIARHENDNYYLSEERAMYNAENESNTIWNKAEYVDATNNKTKKQWVTMKDRHVRHTHRNVDNKVVDIDEPFSVGDSLLNFPKDYSLGAEGKECVNCRCTIKYF